MEYTVTRDDLKIILLKCVGSKYPVRLMLRNNDSQQSFIRGFKDSHCTVILVSGEKASEVNELKLDDVKRIETHNQISLDRLRSRAFNVN